MRTFSAFFCAAFCVFFLEVSEGRAANCSATPHNLVTNCGFETGTFAGWTLSGNDVPSELNNLYGVEGVDPIDGIAPHNGSYQAFVADLASNATTLSQSVTTVAGDAYVISFDLAQDTLATAGYPNILSLSFNGVSLYSQTDVPVEGYTQYSFTGLTTSSSSVLDLTLGNGLGQFLLDDVSVVLVPEPSTWPLALGGALLAAGLLRHLHLTGRTISG